MIVVEVLVVAATVFGLILRTIMGMKVEAQVAAGVMDSLPVEGVVAKVKRKQVMIDVMVELMTVELLVVVKVAAAQRSVDFFVQSHWLDHRR